MPGAVVHEIFRIQAAGVGQGILVHVHEAVERLIAHAAIERLRQVRPIQRRDAREVHAHQMLGTEDAVPVCSLDVSDSGLTQLKLL